MIKFARKKEIILISAALLILIVLAACVIFAISFLIIRLNEIIGAVSPPLEIKGFDIDGLKKLEM